jgi:flagellar protein FlaJ
MRLRRLLDTLSPCRLFEDKIRGYAEYYGEDYREFCTNYSKFVTPLIVGLPVISIIFFIYFKLIMFLLPLCALPALFLVPIAYSWAKSVEHLSRLESEMPFFSLLVLINVTVGKGLIQSFRELIGFGLFKAFEVEWKMIRRSITLFNLTPNLALERRATLYTNREVGRFLWSYLNSERAGVAVKETVRDVTEEVMDKLSSKLEQYKQNSLDLVEVVFALFLLLPIMLLGFYSTFNSGLTLLLFPLLAVFPLHFAITAMQPLREFDFKLKPLDLIPFSSFLILFLHRLDLLSEIYISSMIVLGYFTSYFLQVRNYQEINKSMPSFIKEVRDLYRLGYGIKVSILRVEARSFRPLAKILMRIQRDIRFKGEMPLLHTPSHLLNLIFGILKVLDEKGGKNEDAINKLHQFIANYNQVKSKVLNQFRLFEGLALASPLILAFALFSVTSISISHHAINLVKPLIFCYSAALACLFVKISRFTLLYTPPIIAAVTLSYVILEYFLPAH